MAGLSRAGRAGWLRPLAPPFWTMAVAAGVVACALFTATAARDVSGGATATGRSARPHVTIAATTTTAEPTTTTLPPLAVAQVAPADNTKGVGPGAPVVVTYSRAPGPAVPRPTISPATAGVWSQAGARQLVFKPAGYWQPGITYRVSVPVQSGTRAVKFTTRLPSVLTLQQYLAMLGYLPLRFTPTGDIPNRKAVLEKEPTSANMVPQVPAPGVFTWAYPGIPASLWQQWHRGYPNVVTTGAVMQFELAHGLAPDGDAGPLVWHALLGAIAKRQMDPNPYNYVIVSEALPETLYVWQDGKFVYDTLTNTGVEGASTPQGTWPVAYKQNPNLMKGCDVNGSCYSVWVKYASYFLPSVGDAIHAYPRPGYGYPQSNGCVEVPPSQGAIVYGYDPVGTLVTVTSWAGPAQDGR
jgi:peptidoglycan hydrolase-like protein with peptidoglycan-binding domain